MDYLFVYGTLMLRYPENPHRDLLEKHCRDSFDAWCPGELYTLKEYPAMIRGAGRVYGEILQLQNVLDLFKILDAYEGFYPDAPEKSYYLRVKTEVYTTENIPCSCWTYFYNRPVKNLKKLDSGRFF